MLGPKSRRNLQGVHPELVTVVERAAATGLAPFMVGERLRTAKRQAELVAAGAPATMKSRHLTGHAVDLWVLVGGKVRWDWPLYHKLAAVMEQAAQDTGVA